MKNWAGNLEYASADVQRPESVAELGKGGRTLRQGQGPGLPPLL